MPSSCIVKRNEKHVTPGRLWESLCPVLRANSFSCVLQPLLLQSSSQKFHPGFFYSVLWTGVPVTYTVLKKLQILVINWLSPHIFQTWFLSLATGNLDSYMHISNLIFCMRNLQNLVYYPMLWSWSEAESKSKPKSPWPPSILISLLRYITRQS